MRRHGFLVAAVLAGGALAAGCDRKTQDSQPWAESPASDTVPTETGDTSLEQEPRAPSGERDLEEVAGFLAWPTGEPWVGEFTGDGADDYLFAVGAYTVVAGPLTGSLDFTGDVEAVVSLGAAESDWHVSDIAIGHVAGEEYSDAVFSGLYSYHSGGAAYLYHGAGLHDRVLGDDAIGDAPDATLLYDGEEQAFGSSASAGDLDADGYDDLLLGSPNRWSVYDGAVYLFMGPIVGTIGADEADTIFTEATTVDHLGWSVDLHGDFDADGMKDAVMDATNGLFVFDGPAPSGGVDVTEADSVLSPYGFPCEDMTVGDLDGDGHDDLVLGLYDAHAVWVFPGPLAPAFTLDEAGVYIEHRQSYSRFGVSASLEQDLDADGRDDLVVGAPDAFWEGMAGGAYVFYGPLEGSLDDADADALLRVRYSGEHSFQGPGWVAPGGDVNQDGYEDFFVSALFAGGAANDSYWRTYAVFGGVR